jgi:tetrahydromethanopterin S-methyltransferase subunit G
MQYITEIIIGVLALVGTLGGSYMSHRKSISIIAYRLEQLEKKVDKHNKFAERMPVLEEQMKVVNHRLEDLERRGEG